MLMSNVTESPWFWVMTFSAAALVGVTTIAPKYAVREARRERMAEARQTAPPKPDVAASESAADAPPIVPYQDEDFRRSPKLGWLYGSLIALVLVGAVGAYFAKIRSFRPTSVSA